QHCDTRYPWLLPTHSLAGTWEICFSGKTATMRPLRNCAWPAMPTLSCDHSYSILPGRFITAILKHGRTRLGKIQTRGRNLLSISWLSEVQKMGCDCGIPYLRKRCAPIGWWGIH